MRSEASLNKWEQIVLLAVLRCADGAYCVFIRAEILACTGRQTAPGALYTTLDHLEQKLLLLSSRMGEPTAARGGRARRFYTVTHQGKTGLA